MQIKDRINEGGVMTLIGATLTKIASLGGITNEMDSLTRQDIVTMLFSSFKTLSIDEIYFAFQKERYGEYDNKTSHYNLFNADYVSEVLKKYKNWKKDKKSEYNITPDSQILLPEINQSQKDQIHYESLKKTYEQIKATGYDDMAWLIYPYIEGKITLTKEDKQKIYRQEEKKYLEELRTSFNKSDRARFKSYPKQEQTGRYDSAIQSRCKTRAVVDYVKDHLATLETFLTAIGYKHKET